MQCKRNLLAMLISGSSTIVDASAANRSLFDLTLPQVEESSIGYGKGVSGAVSDKLFYTLGGGSLISQPGTRLSMQKLGVSLGWSSDLMCGNFDLKTTVGNQLNGITNGYKNLMGEVVQGATGAVMSLPAMIIQRSNAGLYDMLTNGVMQANVAYDKAMFSCQNMARRMADYVDSSKWTQQAVSEEYKQLVNSGEADAIRADNAGQKLNGQSGSNWLGGQKRGGRGQPAIRPTRDLAAAGYNMMNNLPVLSTSGVSGNSCDGGVCGKFKNSEDAAQAVVKVLGDRSIRTCTDATECTSGDADQQPGVTVAGTGFAPLLEESIKSNLEQLVKLVNGTEEASTINLAKLKAGSMTVSAGVIKALQRDPDNGALVGRLAGELAMADTIETALLMRRMLVTGLSEPNAAAQPEAMAEGDRRLEALDREIGALRNEMELKRELARNSILTIIERDNNRSATHPQRQSYDSGDARFNHLGLPSGASNQGGSKE